MTPQQSAGAADKPVRAVVVGVGAFGQNHARKLAAMPHVELAGVVDSHEPNARSASLATGAPSFADIRELPDDIDAVVVAAPTIAHARIARPFLQRGVAVFIEKPIAPSVEEAADLVRLARRHGAVLQVGHIERFNPAWRATRHMVNVPRWIEARRFSPYPFRSLDVSVVLDVMIHDLDLALSAADWSSAVRVEAVGGRRLSRALDWARARITFSNGVEAEIAASRVHFDSQRRMALWSDAGTLEIDFAQRQTTRIEVADGYRQRPSPTFPPGLSKEEKDRLLGELFSQDRQTHGAGVDALHEELASFIECARARTEPEVTGEHGLAALALATTIEARIAELSTAPARAA